MMKRGNFRVQGGSAMSGRRLGLFACVLLACIVARGDEQDLVQLSLQELMSVKVAVASNKERTIEDQPGVVTVLTDSQIRNSGARNLSDLLIQVPGFYFAQDVQGGVGPIFRGLWAYEGKTLLIVDGIEMNEMLYGTLQLEHRLPADLIRQVEIIRGPGSAMYGGSAELAVIRVTTKGAEMKGGFAASTVTYSSGKWAEDYSVGYGDSKGDWKWSFNGSYGKEFWATRSYTDLTGVAYSLKRDSDAEPKSANIALSYRDLDLRVLYESIPYENRVDLGSTLPDVERVSFDTVALQAAYHLKANSWLTITPKLGYKIFRPWQVRNENANDLIDVRQEDAGIQGRADISDASNVTLGVDYRRQTGEAKDQSYYGIDSGDYFNGRKSVTYDIYSIYSQYEQETRFANFTVGGRYEHQNLSGGAFVPRVAITKSWSRWHAKALFSEAFRTPNIHIFSSSLTPEVKPEHTRSYEVETGYKFTEHLQWVGNLFYIQLKNPLVYNVTPGGDGYFNEHEIATYGLETEIRASWSAWDGTLSYSLYRADRNSAVNYQTENRSSLMGAPNHKIAAASIWHFAPNWLWNVNGTFVSERYAYQFGSSGLGKLAPEWLLNTYVEHRIKQVHFGLGVANLLNETRWYPQPYSGGAGALPGRSREYYVRVRFEF